MFNSKEQANLHAKDKKKQSLTWAMNKCCISAKNQPNWFNFSSGYLLRYFPYFLFHFNFYCLGPWPPAAYSIRGCSSASAYNQRLQSYPSHYSRSPASESKQQLFCQLFLDNSLIWPRHFTSGIAQAICQEQKYLIIQSWSRGSNPCQQGLAAWQTSAGGPVSLGACATVCGLSEWVCTFVSAGYQVLKVS